MKRSSSGTLMAEKTPTRKEYELLWDELKKAEPSKSKQDIQKILNDLWKNVKGSMSAFNSELEKLRAKTAKNQSRKMSFWTQLPKKPTGSSHQPISGPKASAASSAPTAPEMSSDAAGHAPPIATSSQPVLSIVKEPVFTPAQDKVDAEISVLKGQALDLKRLRSTGFETVSKKDINDTEAKISALESKKRRLVREAERQRRLRAEKKEVIKGLIEKDPENAAMLKKFDRQRTGRPSIDVDQPGLCSAILDIVDATSASDDRRRSNQLRSVKTLDQLTSELQKMDYNLSRSATYLRLLPRRSGTGQAQRHVTTVPVKLIRPEHSLRKKHEDRKFAKCGVDYIKSICEIFGPDAVNVLTTDDKARVPLGLIAAKEQAPILMSLEYKIRLPDHDFVVGQGHKLIPSVYAQCKLKEDGKMSFSGPTFIKIRSAKHDGSNALTHHDDIKQIISDDSFRRSGKIRPILLSISDGASDEGPRFPKVLACSCERFKETGIDVLIHATNAPGLSAYNPCERRMAPLSRDLVGVVLPHDSFGTHLDTSGRTKDIELEKANFAKASEILKSIWEERSIDGYEVQASCVPPGTRWSEPPETDERWIANHVRQSKYFLQIVKCNDTSCCAPFVSQWMEVFPKRFLPVPIVTHFQSGGRKPTKPEDVGENEEFLPILHRLYVSDSNLNIPEVCSEPPFDLYCPSMRKNLQSCICTVCGMQWPNKTAVGRHMRAHKKQSSTMKQKADMDEEPMPVVMDEPMPVIASVKDFIAQPWEKA